MFNDLEKDWNRNESCLQKNIDSFISSTGWNLPNDYQEFLTWSNGGEGYVGKNYLSLWKLEDIVQLNMDYQIQEFLKKDCLVFGTDGGGVCYGFDFASKGKVFKSSLGDLDVEEMEFLANDFKSFLMLALTTNIE